MALCFIAAAVPPSVVAAQVGVAVPVTLSQFRAVHELQGRWRVTGGGDFSSFPAAFEEYLLLNDSTLRMRTSDDDTFRRATHSADIELRAGTMRSRPQTGNVSDVVRIARDTIVFGAQSGDGTTLIRIAADHWRAVAGSTLSGPGAR